MVDRLSLDNIDQTERLAIDDTPPVPLSGNALADRASRMTTAWPEGPNKPDYNSIRDDLQQGKEHDLRSRLSYAVQGRDEQTKADMIRSMAAYQTAQGKSELHPDDQNFLFYSPDDAHYDPSITMEREYGNKIVSNVVGKTEDPNHPFNVAQKEDYAGFHDAADIVSENASKDALLRTMKQDVDTQLSRESYLGWTKNIAKGLVPFWNAYDFSQTGGPQAVSFLSGDAMDEKIRDLRGLPYDQFAQQWKDTLSGLDIHEQSLILDQALQHSNLTTTLSNLGTVADVTTVGELGAKALLKAFGGVANIAVQSALKDAVTPEMKDQIGKILDTGVTMDTRRQVQAILDKGSVTPEMKEQIKGILDKAEQGDSSLINTEGMRAKVADILAPYKTQFNRDQASRIQKMLSGEAVKDYHEPLATIAHATQGPVADPQNVIEKVGDIKTAARINFLQRMSQAFPMGSLGDRIELMKDLPSLYRFDDHFADLGTFSREAAQRLRAGMSGRADLMMNLIQDANRVQVSRLPQTALGQAFSETEAELRSQYTRLQDMIMELRRIPSGADEAGVNRVELVLGRTSADFFENPGEALATANRAGLRDGTFQIRPQGNGYYLSLQKAVDETKDSVRDLLIDTSNADPTSNINALFGKFRSAQDLLSDLQRANRHIALMPANMMKNYIERIAEPLTDLSRKDRADLKRLAIINRDKPIGEGTNPTQRGYFYKSLGEFQQDFIAKIGHPPSEAQADAYWTYVQLSDAEFYFRNTTLRRDLERQGIEQVSFRYHDGQQGMTSPWFQGRTVSDLPWRNTQDFNVYRAFPDWTGELITNRNNLEEEKELIKEGKLKVIQVANPSGRPLSEVVDSKIPIHFVLSDSYDTKPLGLKQIEYNPGGHSIYTNQAFVKQPVIERGAKGMLHYLTDKNVFNFPLMQQAEKVAQIMDAGRIALRTGNEAALPSILKQGIPLTTEQFKALFKEGGQLSLDHPVVATRAGQRAIDGKYNGRVLRTLEQYNPEGETLRDEIYSSYNLYNSLDKEFLQDKDAILPTIKRGEREGDPFYNLAPSKQLDPFAALQRGLGGSIRQLWLNDYKTSAIEQWIEQYKGLFTGGKQSYVRGNPTYFFFNADLKKTNATYGDVQRAEASRQAIINFLGVKTELGEKLDWMRWQMMDGMYSLLSRVSPKYAEGFANQDFVTNFLTPGKVDPARYMRNMAFHSVIGLFNPMRYLLHAMYSTHVLAIAGPQRGWQGMAASGLLQYMTMHGWTEDEALIAHTAKLASNLGFGTPEEFKEMYGALRASGWGLVGNESAWKQDMFDPSLFTTTGGKFLNAGTWFFRKGEQFARLSAFGAAYKEWKAANPVIELDSRELGQIMTRADDLSINMTRASLAGWQRGYLSVVSQFATYNLRLMEQMLPGALGLSNRITPGEAWRAIGMYSLLFGIPTTIAGTTGFFPAYESLQKAAEERGINLHQGWKQLFNDGLLSSAFTLATGRNYNISERIGPNADKLLYDWWNGEKGLPEVLAGPSGSMLSQGVKSMMPGLKGAVDWAMGAPDEYPIRPVDFLDVARNVGSVSQGFKFWMAANAGKYYARNDRIVANDLDAYDGLMMALTGTTPTEVTDNTLRQNILRDEREYKDRLGKQYTTDLQRAMREYKSGNIDAGRQFLQRAKSDMAAGNFRPDEVLQLLKKSVNEETFTEIQKTNRDFWRYSPQSQQKDRLDMIQQEGK